jgi:nucleoside-diphosphate-sugar epimerase
MRQTGLVPEPAQGPAGVAFGYVDETAAAIRLIIERPAAYGKVWHIVNPHTVTFTQMLAALGITAKALPPQELKAALRQIASSSRGTAPAAAASAAADYLGRLTQGEAERQRSGDVSDGDVCTGATLALLHRIGFKWSEITDEYIKEYLR